MKKYCVGCYLTKPHDAFNFCKNSKDKLQSYCRECQSKVYKKYRETNPLIREKERAYEKIRYQKILNGEMPHRREAVRIRNANNKTVRNIEKVRDETFIKWFSCSKKTFIARFEKEFAKNPGMGWHNYGAWHMDHIKPLGSFPLNTKANRKLANHYSNLRPIWATANMKKAYKYNEQIYS